MDILSISHGVTPQTTRIVVDMVPDGVGYRFSNTEYPFNLKSWLRDGSLYVVDAVSVTWSATDSQIVEALGSPAPVLTLTRTRDGSPVGRGSLPVVTGGVFSPLSVARDFEDGDDLSLHTAGTLIATPDLALKTAIRAYVQLRIFEVLDRETQRLIRQSYGESWETPLSRRRNPNGDRSVRLVAEGGEDYTFEERRF
jgi:hypothetical protein